MKIAAVTMVKNESDIIELFIKINSDFFDHFFIIDHCSTDGTLSILDQLIYEGHPITCVKIENIAFNQSKIITDLVREVSISGDYSYVMPIDCDEFIETGKHEFFKDLLLEKKSEIDIVYLPWKGFCPTSINYFGTEAPLLNFKARAKELHQYYKVILSSEFSKECTVEAGNHDAFNENVLNCRRFLSPINLYHVPVRSPEQLIRKVILGAHAFSQNIDRVAGQGYHWDELATMIRNKNYQLTEGDLLDISIKYASDPNLDNELLIESPVIGGHDSIIKYKDLARINLLQSFDNEINSYSNELKLLKARLNNRE